MSSGALLLVQTVILAATGVVVFWYTWETRQIRQETANANRLISEQLANALRQDKENRRAVDARISALGYLLRRQLRSWLGIELHETDGLENWLRSAQNAQMFGEHIDHAEHTVIDMVTLASRASEDISERVREAYVFFLAGTDRLNRYASTSRPSGDELWDWMQLRRDAENDFRDCLAVLEANIVDRRLLTAENTLQQRRIAEDPFNRIGEILEAQLESEEDAEERPSL